MMKRGQRVGVVSLGCSKNRVDTEVMLGYLRDAGYEIVSDPQQAEVLIVNTCGFIESAKTEAIDTLLEMAAYKKTGNCRVLVATGCMVQRYLDELSEALPEVDVFLGVASYPKIAAAIKEALAGTPVRDASVIARLQDPDATRVLTTPGYTAYVKIGEGCNNRCAFCAIPLIRGHYASRPMAEIVREVKGLAEKGVKEITLIAQDTTRYGEDLPEGKTLADLLEAASRAEGLEWLRVLYCYPNRVSERLFDTMAALENVPKYLDMPLQHINDDILRAMRREGDGAQIRRAVDMAKARGMTLRSTFIVGFPGETEAQFEELLAFIKETRFDHLGAFAFSPEEGTTAANMTDLFVPDDVKARRLDTLMRLQQGISLERKRERIGQTLRVLVEGQAPDGRYYGRSAYEAPEIDGKVFFKAQGNVAAGDFVQVSVQDAAEYDLMGVQVK